MKLMYVKVSLIRRAPKGLSLATLGMRTVHSPTSSWNRLACTTSEA